MPGVTKSVPFLDLSAEFRELEGQWLAAIKEVGARGSFILGPNVSAFEREFADHVGSKHAIGVANGTDALVLSLRALGIGPGHEVITSPFTFFATAEAVTLVGAKPVFADIVPESFNIDPDAIRACINGNTRAILPVHLFGCAARMDAIMAIAREHKLAVIEDCAQAFGANENGKRVGAFGSTGCFSFYPTKVLGCYGDGGMITTDSADTDQHVRRLRNHGAVASFTHTEIGYNSRLDEIQAALLRIKLRAVDRAIAGRRRVAGEYAQALQGSGVILPSGAGHVFNLYTIRTRERERVRQRMNDNQIANAVCYARPLHLQEVYRDLGYRPGTLPVAERLATEVLSLPIYPTMESAQIARVCEVIREALTGA